MRIQGLTIIYAKPRLPHGLNAINNQTHMLIMTNVSSTADLKDMVQRGQLEGGIVIPSNFSQSLMTGQQGTIIIVSDESNPQISATIQGALRGVFDAMGTALAHKTLTQQT